jgi:hypothetical protein
MPWINLGGLMLCALGSLILTIYGPPSGLDVTSEGTGKVTWTNEPEPTMLIRLTPKTTGS